MEFLDRYSMINCFFSVLIFRRFCSFFLRFLFEFSLFSTFWSVFISFLSSISLFHLFFFYCAHFFRVAVLSECRFISYFITEKRYWSCSLFVCGVLVGEQRNIRHWPRRRRRRRRWAPTASTRRRRGCSSWPSNGPKICPPSPLCPSAIKWKKPTKTNTSESNRIHSLIEKNSICIFGWKCGIRCSDKKKTRSMEHYEIAWSFQRRLQ